MTTEEARQVILNQVPRNILTAREEKEASIVAEVISVLQRKNLNYRSASSVLERCEDALEQIARI